MAPPVITLGGPALAALVAAGALLAVSGVPGLLFGWRSPWGPRSFVGAVLAAALLGGAGTVAALAGGQDGAFAFASPVPGHRAALGVDALGAFFLLPVFLVGALGALYGAAYWPPRRQPRNGRRLRFCYGLLLASLTFILLSRDGISFLIAWEGMALTNFFLITTEDDDAAARRAGWLYLLYSHVTMLSLFALFVLARRAGGDFLFATLPPDLSPALRTTAFALALVAFGIKAGAMPVHSWLPAAHATAPTHVSALMSGVVIKIGIYGLLRATALLPAPPLAWGMTVLAVGALSAFCGVAFALAQHDLKRLLAYHSIENIGIILLGLGLALVGRAAARPEWVLLGLAGCLLHVWNHALFKSLLFFGAGSVAHAAHTRDLERTGGLARRMPVTAALFLVGAVAICGLPPLNGLVSELLVYLGLLRVALAPGSAWAALPLPVLAATGGLAVACFVKVFGIVFLGVPRAPGAAKAHESPPLMLAPMAVLAVACIVLGVAPALAVPALERAAAAWMGGGLDGAPLATLAPFGALSRVALALLAAVALLSALVVPAARRARRRQPELPTWDCGYAAGSPRLQYTASSFAQIITSRLAWLLRPRVHPARVDGPFPAPARFHSHVGDTVLDHLLLPGARAALRLTAALRALPAGQLQRYILYVVAVLVPLLAWALAGGGGGG